jgi:hypothetical protein
MSFDLVRATTMTRALSPSFLGGLSDADVHGALQDIALPLIRTYFLTATNGAGQPLLYTLLTDLGSTATSNNAESIIDSLFVEPTLADSIRGIAARLAAISLLSGNFPTLVALEKINARTEKAAMAELERITKSPQLKTAAAAALTRVTASSAIAGTTLIMLALDANASTKNLTDKTVSPYTGAQLPYVGAPEAGKLGMILDGQSVEVTVAAGDVPAHTLDQLLKAFELMASNIKPNANLLVNEKVNLAGNANLTYPDPVSGAATTNSFSLTSSGATLSLVPRAYDPLLQVAAATFYLTSRDPNNTTNFIPGLRGYRYGVTPRWNDLTQLGPHAVAANLTQGKSTHLSAATTAAGTKAAPLSDAFFFACGGTGGVTAAVGSLVYQINYLSPVTVAIPAGSSPLDVASLMSQSLSSLATTQRVIGAVRPPTSATPSGTPASAPSLELVSFVLESALTSIVVTIKSVPADITFAVVALNSLTGGLFDGREKAVVVATVVDKPRVPGLISANNLPGTDAGYRGAVVKVVHVQSPALAKIITAFTRRR